MGKRKTGDKSFIIIDKRIDEFYYVQDEEVLKSFINDRARNKNDFEFFPIDYQKASKEFKNILDNNEVMPLVYEIDRYLTQNEMDAFISADDIPMSIRTSSDYIMKDLKKLKLKKDDFDKVLYACYLLKKKCISIEDKFFVVERDEEYEEDQIELQSFFDIDVLYDTIISQYSGHSNTDKTNRKSGNKEIIKSMIEYMNNKEGDE